MTYSWRMASIGDKPAARSAGNVPNTSPTLAAETIDIKIVADVTAARS
jgi:hypothetical protein